MFATSFPEHPESARVLTKADEDLFALNEFDRVIEVSTQILERNPPVERGYQRTAATLLAHSLFDRGRFAEAEAAYVRVQGYLPPNDPDRPAIEERIAASIYKQAEAKQTAGDATGAVDDFLRVGAAGAELRRCARTPSTTPPASWCRTSNGSARRRCSRTSVAAIRITSWRPK